MVILFSSRFNFSRPYFIFIAAFVVVREVMLQLHHEKRTDVLALVLCINLVLAYFMHVSIMQ